MTVWPFMRSYPSSPYLAGSAILYTPPPLDAVGLRILRELRGSGSSWKRLGRVRSLEHAMQALGTANWIGPGCNRSEFRDMRGYIEVRHTKEPVRWLRGVGRDAQVLARDTAEYRLTGLGEAELERGAA